MTITIFLWLLFILLAAGAVIGLYGSDVWKARGSGGAWLILLILIGAIMWQIWPWGK